MKKIGIIGGSGLENINSLTLKDEKILDTPYGSPTSAYYQYESEDITVYNISRHGKNHEYAPHLVNYQANIWGFKHLEVDAVVSFSAVGGINYEYKNGDLVLTSDAIDMTSGRKNTFFDKKGEVIHIDMSSPFCKSLRNIIKKSSISANITLIDKGIYICTNGPRFETPAEINMYRLWGADMVGMTLFPEITLTREMGMCYANISLITNAASGVEEDRKLTSDEVIDEALVHQNKISKLVNSIILLISEKEKCFCADILKGASISSK